MVKKTLIFAAVNVFFTYAIVFAVTASPISAALSVFLLSTDPMIKDQMIHAPILDIIQVAFLLGYFFFLTLYMKSDKVLSLIFAGLFLGAMAATKLYFPVFFVLGATGIFFYLKKESLFNSFKIIILLAALAGTVYTLSYLKYFLEGNSIRSFLGVQKWMFLFWKDNSVSGFKYFGDFVTLTLFNRWRVWWGNDPYISYVNWSVLWPVYLTTGWALSVHALFNKKIRDRKTPLTWIITLFSIWIVPVS